MRWFPRVALVGLVVGLALPVATAQATTTVERSPFEATLTECGETITLSGTLLGVFTVQDLGGDGLLLTFHFQPQGVSGTSSTACPTTLLASRATRSFSSRAAASRKRS